MATADTTAAAAASSPTAAEVAAANRQRFGDLYGDVAAAVDAYPFKTLAELRAEVRRLGALAKGGCPRAAALEAEARELRRRTEDKLEVVGQLLEADDFDGAEAAKAKADALRAEAAELEGRAARLRAAAAADAQAARRERAELERPLALKKTVEAELGRLERAKEEAKDRRDIDAAKAAVVRAKAFERLRARVEALPIFKAREEAALRLQVLRLRAVVKVQAARYAELRQRVGGAGAAAPPSAPATANDAPPPLRAAPDPDDVPACVAAEAAKQQLLVLQQARDAERAAAEAEGWAHARTPDGAAVYYYRREEPARVFFSWQGAQHHDAQRSLAAQQQARAAELAEHEQTYGKLYAQIEAYVDEWGAQTLADVRVQAAALGPAVKAEPDAAALQEADRLDAEAGKLRAAAAEKRAEAKAKAEAQDYAAAKAAKAGATELEARASELEERSLAARAGEGGGASGDAAQAAREALERGPRLHQQRVDEVARLRKERDARVAGGDYAAAAALDRKGDAYEALGKQLEGLAVMRWHAAREAAAEEEACRAKAANAEMETLRSELAAQERKAAAASAPDRRIGDFYDFGASMDELRRTLRGHNVESALRSMKLTPLSRPYFVTVGPRPVFLGGFKAAAGCSILEYAMANGLACVVVLQAWEY